MSGSSDSEDELVINKEFAKKFESEKRNQELGKKDIQEALLELHRLERGSESENSEEESESEDEDGELLTADLDNQIMETLLKIRKKDPSIYDKSAVMYSKDSVETSTSDSQSLKKKKSNSLSVKQAIVNNLLDGREEDADEVSDSDMQLSFSQEQEKLKKAFEEDNLDAEEEDFFKSKEEVDSLSTMKGQSEVALDPSTVDEYFKSTTKDQDMEFLKDYILKGWWKADPSKVPLVLKDTTEHPDLSEDENSLVAQDKFEYKYNFRFEEPDAHKIQTFPREIEDSMRKKDTKRKDAREKKKERRDHLMKLKEEEVRQLQKFKEKELEKKIETIKSISGFSGLDIEKLSKLDVDGDFNPDEFDKQMEALFDDKFYATEDAEPEMIGEDPFDGQEDMEIPEGYDEEYEDKANEEDHIVSKEEVKGLVNEILSAKQEVEKSYREDFEDILGDSRARFRYIKVPTNDFGLEIERILNEDDKDLNRKVSLRYLAPYRDDVSKDADWRSIQKMQKQKYKEYMTKKRQRDERLQKDVDSNEEPAKKKKKMRSRTRRNLKLSQQESLE